LLDFATVWPAISLTLSLSALTTLILLVIGTPIGWWLARSAWVGKDAAAAVVALPLVLPPTVLGFYLLMVLGPFGPGGWLAGFWGARTLAFSFTGLVIGSVFYSLPFMVHPLRAAFEVIGEEELEVASTLGASNRQRFFRVAIPLARTGFINGAVFTFAHTIGEFGVVLMLGGNIPGQTKVISIAIYDYVERLEWGSAHILAFGMVVFSLIAITTMMMVDRRLRLVRI
jgi:molybdate transport system permease protein